MAQQDWSTVGKPVRKKDAMALLLGRPAYLDDLTPKDCLVVKVLRSPHAHALIEEIDTENAEQIPGVAAIFTYRDVPQKRFTMAGQTYPEPSPYDRLILDRRGRFVGGGGGAPGVGLGGPAPPLCYAQPPLWRGKSHGAGAYSIPLCCGAFPHDGRLFCLLAGGRPARQL